MKQRALTEKQQYWLSHIQSCEQAGSSMADYARQHELDMKRFYNWKWLLAKRELLDVEVESVSFARVEIKSRNSANAGMTVHFPNGCQLALGEPAPARLEAVIHALVKA